jgi:hypothetical protein
MRIGLLLESVILNLHPQCATWKCHLAPWRHQSTRDDPVPAQARIPSSFSRAPRSKSHNFRDRKSTKKERESKNSESVFVCDRDTERERELRHTHTYTKFSTYPRVSELLVHHHECTSALQLRGGRSHGCAGSSGSAGGIRV